MLVRVVGGSVEALALSGRCGRAEVAAAAERLRRERRLQLLAAPPAGEAGAAGAEYGHEDVERDVEAEAEARRAAVADMWERVMGEPLPQVGARWAAVDWWAGGGKMHRKS